MQFGKATWMGSWWKLTPSQKQNIEHIRTPNGDTDDVQVEYEFVDPRQARPKQRALFFALLGDIHQWSGEPTDWLKEYFYTRYTVKTAGGEISLAADTKNTVSDAIKLIDDVIDFIFEFGVPVHAGYPLLPRDENYFQYECIKHRECLICGRHADIHHMEGIPGNTVGMGNNRNKIDHTQRYLAALCREHHGICHQLGTDAFCKKYKLTSLGIKVDARTLKSINLRGEYHDLENN